MPARLPLPALLLALSLAVGAGMASAEAPAADPALKAQVDALGLNYDVDEDGDLRMTFELEDGRSQIVYARSAVETFGSTRIREIWSPGYRYTTPELDQKVANRLLEHSKDTIMGGWTRQKSTAMYVVKIPADSSNATLRDALEVAALAADVIERELTDGKDDL